MKKRNQSRGIPTFYIVYLSVLAAVILFIIFALGIVTQRLAEYEAVQPKHTAGEIFGKYFTPEPNYSLLLADAVYDNGGVTEAEIAEHLRSEIGESEITYSLGSSTEEGVLTYIVKAGNVKFAAINLKESDVVTEHGYKTYEFASLELYVSTEIVDVTEPIPTYTVTVNVPLGYSVTVGDTALSDSHIVECFDKKTALPHLPSDVTGVRYCTYKLGELETVPAEGDVKITDSLGNTAEYVYDADALTYDVKVNYSEDLLSAHGEFVTDAITGYAAFMQADSSFKKIKGYFDPDTDLYANLEAASKDLWMVKDHDGYEFTDIEIGEFYQLNETTVSCHISFTHILKREGKEDRPDVIDMYVFLRATEDGYRIYEWYNNK